MRNIFFIFLLFISFNKLYAEDFYLKEIRLININQYCENSDCLEKNLVKDFFLNTFFNITNEEIDNYIFVNIAMLSNTFSSCINIYKKDKLESIKCITSKSLNDLPRDLMEVSKDFLKPKKRIEDIALVLEGDIKKDFNNIYLLSNKSIVILFDKPLDNSKPNKKFYSIKVSKNKYNIFYLDKEESLKIFKIIFDGKRIDKVYLERNK